MAGNFVNPLSQVQAFRNQKIEPMIQGKAPGASPQHYAALGTAPQKPGLQVGSGLQVGGAFADLINASKSRMSAMQKMALQAPKQAAPTGEGWVGPYKLNPVANRALAQMNAAFRKQFGKDISIMGGGRTLAEQQKLYDLYKAGKGNLAAKPGHSQHNKGLAIDLGGGVWRDPKSREHQWLQQNAYKFGWAWTGKNFKQFEPWHFEYLGAKAFKG